MTNHGYPDDETALSIDDEGNPWREFYESPGGAQEPDDAPEPEPEPGELPGEETHSHGAHNNELSGSRRTLLEDAEQQATYEDEAAQYLEREEDEPTAEGAPKEEESLSDRLLSSGVALAADDSDDDSNADGHGLISDGLTQHELIAFISSFLGSYALAGLFYWGMLSSGIQNTPTQMWILLGILVLAPLALMFGLQQTSGVANVILNRGSR